MLVIWVKRQPRVFGAESRLCAILHAECRVLAGPRLSIFAAISTVRAAESPGHPGKQCRRPFKFGVLCRLSRIERKTLPFGFG